MSLQTENNPDILQHKNQNVHSFPTALEWERWLEKNHAVSKGIWLRFYKKGSGIPSVNYQEALNEALCYGWIDGQLQKYDEGSYLQKFTPRRPKSMWSKRNLGLVAKLEKEGRMKPAGLREINAAIADGRFDRAYDSPSKMNVPDEFLLELSKNKKALSFFEKLNKANKYAIAYRLQTAKNAETREKRMNEILEMMANEKKFHE